MSAVDRDPTADDAPQPRRFTILAQAEPGLLPRLIEPLAKRGLVPARLEAIAEGAALRATLSVELDAAAAQRLGASLRAIVGVTTVLTDPA